jgi:endonuclease-3
MSTRVAYKQLVALFPTWENVRDAQTDKIVDAIKCGGLANIKAVRIQDVLFTLTEQQEAQGITKTLSEYLFDEVVLVNSTALV